MADLITTARAQQSPLLVSIDGTLLATLITAASKRIEKYCRRGIAQATYTDELYDGDGGTELQLRQFPLITLTSVTVIEDDDDEVALTVGNFRTIADEGLIKFKPNADDDYTYFPRGFRNIKVTYDAGYATVPEDVQDACVMAVEYLYDRHMRETGVKSEKLGQYSVSFSDGGELEKITGLPEGVLQMIAPYRDKFIA